MVRDYILEATKCLENDNISIAPQELRSESGAFDTILNLIAYKLEEFRLEHRVSEPIFKDFLKEILLEIQDNEDPISQFYTELENVFENLDQTTYNVAFPLNISHSKSEVFKLPITIREIEINQISEQKWRKKTNKAKEDREFEKFIEELPGRYPYLAQDNPISSSNNTFYETTYTASDPHYAVNQISSSVELLLGTVNFSMRYWRVKPIRMKSTTWKYGFSQLQSPLCYLVQENDTYIDYYPNQDRTPRTKVSLLGSKQERLDLIYPLIPDFQPPLSDLEEYLVSSFAAFQRAISDPIQDRAFLSLWQALESITLLGERSTDGSEKIIRRASAVGSPNYSDIVLGDQIEQLADKRNKLVHTGKSVSITEGDINMLKILFDITMRFILEERNRYSVSDFQFLFEYGTENIDRLKFEKESYEREIEEAQRKVSLLEDIQNWKSDGNK